MSGYTADMPTFWIGLLVSWSTALLALWINPKPVVWIAYGFVNPLLFALPRIAAAVSPAVRARLAPSWFRTVETVAILVILVNAPGSLVLHDLGVQYDRFLHFTVGALVPFLAVPVVAAIRGRGATRPGTFWIAAALTLIGLFGFELFQFTTDRVFGTLLFHDEVQAIQRDVTEDIMFGTLGLLLSAIVLRRSKRVWHRFAVEGIKEQADR